nr:linker for activation of T-cells family member 2 isoform X1 [Equus caballus]XP_023511244.1 linker for activation of T-cells family member 2 isoform X1 [Equus caballus]
MSTETETELLWPGAALLLLLGAVAGLCMRCSRPGTKRSEKIYQQRSLHENQQSFAVARTYSLVRQAWPGPLADTASDVEPARKDKLLRFSPSLEDPASARYQDFSKGSRHGTDAAYMTHRPGRLAGASFPLRWPWLRGERHVALLWGGASSHQRQFHGTPETKRPQMSPHLTDGPTEAQGRRGLASGHTARWPERGCQPSAPGWLRSTGKRDGGTGGEAGQAPQALGAR